MHECARGKKKEFQYGRESSSFVVWNGIIEFAGDCGMTVKNSEVEYEIFDAKKFCFNFNFRVSLMTNFRFILFHQTYNGRCADSFFFVLISGTGRWKEN